MSPGRSLGAALLVAYLFPMRVDNHAGLEADKLEAIAHRVAHHETLQDVVRWGVLYTPPVMVVDVVVQDEFTHDVIVPFRDGLYLVYDTT